MRNDDILYLGLSKGIIMNELRIDLLLKQARTYACFAQTLKSNYYLGKCRECLALVRLLRLGVDRCGMFDETMEFDLRLVTCA